MKKGGFKNRQQLDWGNEVLSPYHIFSSCRLTISRRVPLNLADTVFLRTHLVSRRMLGLYLSPRRCHRFSVISATPRPRIWGNTKSTGSRSGSLATTDSGGKALNEVWVNRNTSCSSSSPALRNKTKENIFSKCLILPESYRNLGFDIEVTNYCVVTDWVLK